MLVPSSHNLSVTASVISFASVLAGSLGLPVPSLAALVFVGSLLAKQPGLVETSGLVFLAAMAGAILGDTVWFMAGRRYGISVLGLVCRLSLSRDSCVRRTAELFERRGVNLLLFARFVPGLSVVSAPLAAISGIRLLRFLAYAETGAALWICTGLALGLGFADQVDNALLNMEHVGLSLGGFAVVLVLSYAGFSWLQRLRLLRQLRIARISAHQLAAMLRAEQPPVIVDARSTLERDADPFVIPGALLLDDRGLAQLTAGSPVLGPVVIYCSCPNEITAALIAKQLRKQGYTDVRPLLGGIDAWRRTGQPLQSLIGASQDDGGPQDPVAIDLAPSPISPLGR